MPNLIWFEWEKCPDGYSVKELKPEYFLNPDDLNESPRVKAGAPQWVRCLMEEFNKLSDWQFDFFGPYILPNSDGTMKFRPLELNDAAFMELGSWDGTEKSALIFTNKFGFYQNSYPDPFDYELVRQFLSLEEFSNCAESMAKRIELWQEAKNSGDFKALIEMFNNDEPEYLDEEDSTHLQLRFRPSADRQSPPSLAITPQDLENALWLQFAQAVTGDVQLQKCRICPTWFTYGVGSGRRKSAQYCTDRCRKAAHRQRKEKNQ